MTPNVVDAIINACIVDHDLEDLIPLRDRVEAASESVLHPIFCALNAERAAGHIPKEFEAMVDGGFIPGAMLRPRNSDIRKRAKDVAFEEVYDEQKAEENS